MSPVGGGRSGPLLVDAFGAPWVLDVDGLGAPLAGRVRALWARAASGPAPDREALPFVVAREEGLFTIEGIPHRAADDEVPYLVSRAVTMASIRRRTGECLLLHAAGVSGSDGRTVALVAPSGTGKTTAARVLGAHFGYVSDETVAVEADRTVRPYAKPLSLVTDPDVPHDKSEAAPDELGLLRAPAGLRLVSVVVLDRDPALAGPRLEPIGLVEALAEVIPQTSALLTLPAPMETLVGALVSGGGPWRLSYSEIADCVDLVGSLLTGTASPDPDPLAWTSETGDEPVTDDAGPDPSEDPEDAPAVTLGPEVLLERTPFQHAVHSEGQSLVVRSRRPAVLPGLGSTVWRAAGAPTSVGRLVEVAVERHGAHPGAEEVLTATVQALLASGHLRVAILAP